MQKKQYKIHTVAIFSKGYASVCLADEKIPPQMDKDLYIPDPIRQHASCRYKSEPEAVSSLFYRHSVPPQSSTVCSIFHAGYL